MGMEVRLVLDVEDETVARRAAEAAFATIASLDGRLSDYRPDSVVRAIERAAPDPVEVDGDVLAVVQQALQVARASGGAFDPTVAPVVALWREARQTGRLPDAGALARARALVDWSRVDVEVDARLIRLRERGMRLDLGGVAKGFILQRALDTLRAHGVTRALVEAGGDIVVGEAPRGRGGWQVAASCGEWRPAVTIVNAAMATSGATFQFVEIDGVRYSHVVDPRTGRALTTHHTVHVVAADAALADAWATALGVLGPDGARIVTLPAGLRYCVR